MPALDDPIAAPSSGLRTYCGAHACYSNHRDRLALCLQVQPEPTFIDIRSCSKTKFRQQPSSGHLLAACSVQLQKQQQTD